MNKNVLLILQVLSLLFSLSLFAQSQQSAQSTLDAQVVVTGNVGVKPFNGKTINLNSTNFGSGINWNPTSVNSSPFGLNYQTQFQVPQYQTQEQINLNNEISLTAAAGALRFNEETQGIIQKQADANNSAKERIAALCDYAVENEVYGNQSPMDGVCKLVLVNPLDRCGLSRAIKQESFNQLIDQFKAKKSSSTSADLKKECFQFAINFWNDPTKTNLEPTSTNAFALVSGLTLNWFGPAFNKSSGTHEILNSFEGTLGCQTGGASGGEASSCNDFSNTAVSSNSFMNLARKYVVSLPDFGGSFLPSVFGKNCSSCFPDRYSFLMNQKNSNPEMSNDEIQNKFKKQSEEKFNDYVEKQSIEKAVLAFSEYTKHLDRINAYSTIIGREGGEATACSDPSNLKIEMEKVRKSKLGCVNDSVINKRIQNISNRIQLGSFISPKVATGVESFFEIVEGRAQEEISSPPTPLSCAGNSVPRGGYDKLRTSDFNEAYLDTFREVLKDKALKSKYEACSPDSEICLVDLVREYFKKNGNSQPEETIQLKFLNNPYIRLLVRNKAGWEVANKMKTGKLVAENFEKNKTALLGLMVKDEKESCSNFQHDLALSLCMKPDKVAGMITPAQIKRDLKKQVEAINSSDKEQLDKNIEILEVMGQACYAISKSDFEKDSKIGLFTSEASANVQNYADPVLRVGMIDKRENSAKIGDEFSDYARKLCNDNNAPSLLSLNPFQTNAPCIGTLCNPFGASGGGAKGGYNLVSISDYDYFNKPLINFSASSSSSYLDGFTPIKLNSSYFRSDSRPAIVLSDEEIKKTFTDKSSSSSLASTQGLTQIPNLPNLEAQLNEKVKIYEKANDKTGSTTNSTEAKSTNNLGAIESTVSTAQVGSSVISNGNSGGVASTGGTTMINNSSGLDFSRTVGLSGNRTSVSSIEREEVAQTNTERGVIDQVANLKDARAQLELEKLRLEMDQLRQSNKSLIASLKKKQTPGSEVVENPFDTQEQPASEDLPVTPKAEVPGRKPASIPVTSVVGGSGGSALSSNVPTAKSIESIGSTTSVTPSRDPGPAQTTTVANFNTAMAAGGGVLIQNVSQVSVSRGRTNFVPSLSLQQSIQTSSTAEPISIEKKVQLVKEFLSYVESNPEYNEGRYLNSNNDQITIDYAGSVMTVKVDDIADPLLRSQLKDRLVRQRLVLNQQVRKQRLESLRRLLASARSDVQ
ncbi:MAG: hypothetical protein K2P81_15315 [Bacteriovoracaceae bacterium]|nr:hypothetical protein [Bacteriovoracaceae bacterium]